MKKPPIQYAIEVWCLEFKDIMKKQGLTEASKKISASEIERVFNTTAHMFMRHCRRSGIKDVSISQESDGWYVTIFINLKN